MSVMLTACKDAVNGKRALERALKKRMERKEEKRQARWDALVDKLGHIPPESDASKVWTFLMEGEPFSIVLYRDSLNVYCNGEEIETLNEFCDDGAIIDFELNGHKARIKTTAGGSRSEGMTFALTIDGGIVPGK
ncbi:hypothetical protein SNE40_000743 [Patella caerulea]|uniref:Uncharacterized protein n=1 Tax=Patella caerulea TaxID=87958 RepID=A0AAN8KHS1_PATCE